MLQVLHNEKPQCPFCYHELLLRPHQQVKAPGWKGVYDYSILENLKKYKLSWDPLECVYERGYSSVSVSVSLPLFLSISSASWQTKSHNDVRTWWSEISYNKCVRVMKGLWVRYTVNWRLEVELSLLLLGVELLFPETSERRKLPDQTLYSNVKQNFTVKIVNR